MGTMERALWRVLLCNRGMEARNKKRDNLEWFWRRLLELLKAISGVATEQNDK